MPLALAISVLASLPQAAPGPGAAGSCTPAWQPATPGADLDGAVTCLATTTDPATGATTLYAGGWFGSAGEQPARHVARWQGGEWSELGGGTNFVVNALEHYDDGTGEALYVGGSFTHAGSVPVNFVARWDGAQWSPLATGLSSIVTCMEVFDDGSGPALYVGGAFVFAGAQTVNRIAKWDGSAWTPLGEGLDNYPRAMVVHDDGSGPALFVAGDFTKAGSEITLRVAKWDGSSWAPVLTGMDAQVSALCVHDEGLGAGPELFAGGLFQTTATGPALHVARWDGASWSPLGGGTDDWVTSLAGFDDGTGAKLYAGGWFQTAGGVFAPRVAAWDGASWSALDSGLTGPALIALAAHDDGTGSALWCGGNASVSGGDSFLMRWSCPPQPGVELAWGCSAKPATLENVSPYLRIGEPFVAELGTQSEAPGIALLYFGADGTDPSGCGIELPVLGELLLAAVPTPLQLKSATTSEGQALFSMTVPFAPQLVGTMLAFQGANVIIGATSLELELTNLLSGQVLE